MSIAIDYASRHLRPEYQIQILKGSNLLDSFTSDYEWATILSWFRLRSLNKGQFVIKQDEIASELSFFLTGEFDLCTVHTDDDKAKAHADSDNIQEKVITVAKLSHGECIGASSILQNQPMDYSVLVSCHRSTFLTLHRSKFLSLVKRLTVKEKKKMLDSIESTEAERKKLVLLNLLESSKNYLPRNSNSQLLKHQFEKRNGGNHVHGDKKPQKVEEDHMEALLKNRKPVEHEVDGSILILPSKKSHLNQISRMDEEKIELRSQLKSNSDRRASHMTKREKYTTLDNLLDGSISFEQYQKDQIRGGMGHQRIIKDRKKITNPNEKRIGRLLE